MYAEVTFGRRRRHCHFCHRRIERTTPHLSMSKDGRQTNLCRECVIRFAEELTYKLCKEVSNAKKKTS